LTNDSRVQYNLTDATTPKAECNTPADAHNMKQ